MLLIDTAGRLHNKANLMEELAKIVRVIRKLDPAKPEASPSLARLDEKAFRWARNQSPMATEKLAEGIRLFAKDLGELRKIVAKRFAA